jgi:beta-lactamase regulating signal transducer with metallopeptidase domain
MLAWILYVVVVTLALSAAAFVAERAARLGRGHSRWIWIAAIVASLVVPTIISSVSVQIPSIVAPTVVQPAIPLRTVTSTYLSPETWLTEFATDKHEFVGMNSVLQRAWLVLSALLLLGLLASGTHLMLRKRRWVQGTMAGMSVYVAADVGPAVVGLLRPCIVVPVWLTQASTARQEVVIAHERSHLEAGDQRLLTIALCLLVFMPWNLPLWWQLRRLRYAIEVDCDARVLKRGHKPSDYGETLIEVGARQSSFVGPVAAMSESKSFLEERISIMMRKQIKWWRLSAATLVSLSLFFVAVAAQVSPPNATIRPNATAALAAAKTQHVQVPFEPTDFDNYVGFYKVSDKQAMTVTRAGQRFLVRFTGYPDGEIYPESRTDFFYKTVDAQITFVAEPQAPATALVVHQKGIILTAPRIDAAAAAQINSAQQHTQVAFEPKDLDRLAGTYKMNENAVITVTRDGQRLLAQLTGQIPAEIYPESSTQFFYKVVDAQISFVGDAHAPATALVLHQNGADTTAPRIDAAGAEQINANAERIKAILAARAKSQTQTPGSEAALRRVIEGMATGNPNYAEMIPSLASVVKKQLPTSQPAIVSLGSIQAVDFLGVGPGGWDIYEVRHEHGTWQWRIFVDTNGIIAGTSAKPRS